MIPLLTSSDPAHAQPLIRQENGQRTSTEALLKEDLILVYAKEDCIPCRKQLQELKNCDASLIKKVQFVSLSTPRQTKKLDPLLSPQSVMHLMQKPSDARKISATPFIRFQEKSQVGFMNCEELHRFIN